MSAGGLMVTSNFANFARDFGVADILLLGLAALPFALTVDRLVIDLVTHEAIPNADEQGAGERFLARHYAGVDELVRGKAPIKLILKSIEWPIWRRCLFEI